jgi:probable phosphoglycerate mutase
MRRMLMLHLVRHGNTSQSSEGVFCGDNDPPLTDRGVAEAERLASAVKPLALDALYCSPKLRARMTADPIARTCGLQPIVDDGLREIAYGKWEGRKESEIAQNDREAFDAWQADPALVSPPGGESAFAIAARSLPVLLRIRREYQGGRVLVVSHKATVRVIVCALLGMPLGRFRTHIGCPTASITSFEFSERGPLLVRVGDVHHLA